MLRIRDERGADTENQLWINLDMSEDKNQILTLLLAPKSIYILLVVIQRHTELFEYGFTIWHMYFDA